MALRSYRDLPDRWCTDAAVGVVVATAVAVAAAAAAAAAAAPAAVAAGPAADSAGAAAGAAGAVAAVAASSAADAAVDATAGADVVHLCYRSSCSSRVRHVHLSHHIEHPYSPEPLWQPRGRVPSRS